MVRPSTVAAVTSRQHHLGSRTSTMDHLHLMEPRGSSQAAEALIRPSSDAPQDYGATSSSPAPSSPYHQDSEGDDDHDGPRNYHGQIRRNTRSLTEDNSRPSSPSSSSSSRSGGSSDNGDLDLDDDDEVLPTYRAFVMPHFLLDMPLALVILVSFIMLSKYGWPVPDSPYPHRFHKTQFATGAVVWIASEAIRRRLFKFLATSDSAFLSSTPFILFLHTAIQEALRLFSVHLAHFPHSDLFGSLADPTTAAAALALALPKTPPRPPKGFFRIFDLALGFAGAEIIWRTLELLGDVRLYKEVLSPEVDRAWLVGEERLPRIRKSDNGIDHGGVGEEDGNATADQSPMDNDNDLEEGNGGRDGTDTMMLTMSAAALNEGDVEAHLRERKRLEFAKSYGCHLWEISVIIIAVWRLDATLLNLTLTLFLALPYHNNRDDTPPRRHPTLPIQLPLWPTFFAVVFLHWLLSLMWTLGVRRRRCGFGLPALSYGTLLLVLTCFFASLGVWSALV